MLCNEVWMFPDSLLVQICVLRTLLLSLANSTGSKSLPL